ncbi:hypothetical protein [Mucilaginibacter sp.]|uniref:hypothetical protein n=1 Tax=Mucilaginibacter sp. TaxID=1882438 RepID=UPI0035BBCDB4
MIRQINCFLLEKNWRIGIASGSSTGLLGATYHFITDEKVLKLISALGIWTGFIVAAVTGAVNIYAKFKRKNKNEKDQSIPSNANH